MAKYSVDEDERVREWHSDRRHVMWDWTDKPFVGHRHHHECVEHRIAVEYHHGVGADVIHEARSDDTEKFSDEWAPVEIIEIREDGARYDRRPELRWLE